MGEIRRVADGVGLDVVRVRILRLVADVKEKTHTLYNVWVSSQVHRIKGEADMPRLYSNLVSS